MVVVLHGDAGGSVRLHVRRKRICSCRSDCAVDAAVLVAIQLAKTYPFWDEIRIGGAKRQQNCHHDAARTRIIPRAHPPAPRLS